MGSRDRARRRRDVVTDLSILLAISSGANRWRSMLVDDAQPVWTVASSSRWPCVAVVLRWLGGSRIRCDYQRRGLFAAAGAHSLCDYTQHMEAANRRRERALVFGTTRVFSSGKRLVDTDVA